MRPHFAKRGSGVEAFKKASAKDGEWVVAKVIMDAKGGGVIGRGRRVDGDSAANRAIASKHGHSRYYQKALPFTSTKR